MAENRKEFYEDPCIDPHCPREVREVTPHNVYMHRRFQACGDYLVPAFDEVCLQLVLNAPGKICGIVDQGSTFDVAATISDLAVAPAGTQLRYTLDNPAEFLTVNFPRHYLIDVVEKAGGKWDAICGPLHTKLFQDPTIEALMGRLWVEVESGAPGGRLCGDGLAVAIATLLADLSGVRNKIQAPPPDWRLRRAMELLQDDLSADVSLAEISAAVDLSARHLRLLFKNHLGRSPHAWLTDRRVDKAKRHLVETRETVTDISFSCGFTSSQHFSDIFRRHVGISPSVYRREKHK